MKNTHKLPNIKQSEQKCTLCGYQIHTLAFKGGYICEDCLHALKADEEKPSHTKL